MNAGRMLLVLLLLLSARGASAADLTPERLRALLDRYPEADANRDGVLTEAEARAHAAALRREGTDRGAKQKAAPSVAPAPTLSDVAYGPHPRQVLDFWRANSAAPTPLVVHIHGGGFVGGDKSGIRRDRFVQECLDAGVSFIAINYRFIGPGVGLPAILRDCARAIQFARYKSGDWNLDRRRVAAYGGSAGAGTSVWLAVHDDLADPRNPDPVLRESTRLACAGSNQGQFSYDLMRWTEVFGEDVVRRFRSRLPPEAYYALETEADLRTEAGRRIRADCDMMALATRDDPPIFISSTLPDLALETNGQYLHHPRHGQVLRDRLREAGVPVVAHIPALGIGPAPGEPRTWREFAFRHLGVPGAADGSGR